MRKIYSISQNDQIKNIYMKGYIIMKTKVFLIIMLVLMTTITACFGEKKVKDVDQSHIDKVVVLMHTSMGDITLALDRSIAPVTVDNFVGLAMGTKEFTDPVTRSQTSRHFYDGLIFHRVIKDFMIQGGCPLGTGTGGPGFRFEDECFDADGQLKATVDYGTICMANSGPNTNGSQFFIVSNRDGCSWLNGRHTVFGRVIDGMDVVHAIENVSKGANDRPITDVRIITVRVVD
jgi:peptidyl-prolyl cis-trans isomerase A (cyclophilin A)